MSVSLILLRLFHLLGPCLLCTTNNFGTSSDVLCEDGRRGNRTALEERTDRRGHPDHESPRSPGVGDVHSRGVFRPPPTHPRTVSSTFCEVDVKFFGNLVSSQPTVVNHSTSGWGFGYRGNRDGNDGGDPWSPGRRRNRDVVEQSIETRSVYWGNLRLKVYTFYTYLPWIRWVNGLLNLRCYMI